MASLGAWVDEVVAHNREPIAETAGQIVRAHLSSGLVYTAGSGHSLAMVMETFFRAGGLAMVRPLFQPELLPLNGALKATAAERRAGMGAAVIKAAAPGARDVVMIFSNSGRNPYPVEIAEGARASGATVVAFTSVAVSRDSEPRGSQRLFEVADIVLDTCTPPGDVSRPVQHPVTSPMSTLACCAVWTEILAMVAKIEPSVPLWRSANRDGNDQFNARLVDQLRTRIPEL